MFFKKEGSGGQMRRAELSRFPIASEVTEELKQQTLTLWTR